MWQRFPRVFTIKQIWPTVILKRYLRIKILINSSFTELSTLIRIFVENICHVSKWYSAMYSLILLKVKIKKKRERLILTL